MEVAREAALQAGAIIRDGLAQPVEIAYKGTGKAARDPVTDVDRRSEAAVAQTIRAHFPHHRLLAEEGAAGGDDPHWRWIVDPLDGTINYAHGLPFSCVSIAAEYDGEVVAGVVYNPLAEEHFTAERGHGATLNGQPIHVSRTDELRRAVLTSAFGPWEANGRRYQRGRALGPHVQALRDLGSAALELCYIACGRIDGMGGSTLNAWDVAAGALIVREAGGQVTDANGDPFKMDGKHVVVSNGLLHGAILARLHDASEPIPPQDRGGERAGRGVTGTGARPRRATRQQRRRRILVALPVLLDVTTS
jgi:myo-inositol-1(or 4)-monophosphatase